MPKAEEGNRTESGKIEHVQSNVASVNKWCRCRQVATEGQWGNAAKDCLCRKVWHILHVWKDVANHVDGEKAMKERTLEARQWGAMCSERNVRVREGRSRAEK